MSCILTRRYFALIHYSLPDHTIFEASNKLQISKILVFILLLAVTIHSLSRKPCSFFTPLRRLQRYPSPWLLLSLYPPAPSLSYSAWLCFSKPFCSIFLLPSIAPAFSMSPPILEPLTKRIVSDIEPTKGAIFPSMSLTSTRAGFVRFIAVIAVAVIIASIATASSSRSVFVVA